MQRMVARSCVQYAQHAGKLNNVVPQDMLLGAVALAVQLYNIGQRSTQHVLQLIAKDVYRPQQLVRRDLDHDVNRQYNLYANSF
jgi:hypothetical protein